MRHPLHRHLLSLAPAAVLLGLAASCTPAPRYVYTEKATGRPVAQAGADSVRVECPRCLRLLTCCTEEDFAIDGGADAHGVAWACPVHGYVATTPHADLSANSCTHGAGKSPTRIVDPHGGFTPAVILRCGECGAGGTVILEQKGATRQFYCAD